MSELAIRQPSANQRWPMTGRTLVDELGRLRADVATLAEASALDDGVASRSSRLPGGSRCSLRCSMPLSR